MKNKRFISSLFLIVMVLLFSPMQAHAHNAYYVSTLIDLSNNLYHAEVINDKESFFSKEAKHLEYTVGNFTNIKEYDKLPSRERVNEDGEELSEEEQKKKDEEALTADESKETKILAFSFPSAEMKDNGEKHATREDSDKAYKVATYVVPGLNDAIVFVNNYRKPSSPNELYEITEKIINTLPSGGSFTIGKESFTSTIGAPAKFKVAKGFVAKDYVTITKADTKDSITVPYRFKKGYKGTDDVFKEDKEYITWNLLAYHANTAYFVKDIALQNSAQIAKPNKVEVLFAELMESLGTQIRTILGLYSIQELVFNDGVRGTSAFIMGAFPKAWGDIALIYHMIFQGFAWSLIMFGIVKSLAQRGLATINSNLRVSLLESFQGFVVAAIGLVMAPVVIGILLYINLLIVNFFGSIAPDFDDLAGAQSGILGGALVQLVFIGLSIYYNFIYIIRSVTLVILIILAPLLISMFAFGGNWKGLFWSGFKEFIANLYVQSFHALILASFFGLTLSSRGIESLVVMMSIIPMTEFFKRLILGNAGEATSQMGMASTAMAGGIAGAGASIFKGGSKNKEGSAGAEKGGAGGVGASGGSSTQVGQQKTQQNSQKMQTIAKSGSKESDNLKKLNNINSRMEASENDNENSKEAFANGPTQLNSNIVDGGKRENPQSSANPLQKVAKGTLKEATKASKAAIKGTKVAAKQAKTATKIGAGAAGAATGAGLAMGVGMANPTMVGVGMATAKQGLGNAKEGISDGAKDAKSTAINMGNKVARKMYGGQGSEGTEQTGRAAQDFNPADEVAFNQLDNGNIQKLSAMETYQQAGIEDAYVNENGNTVIEYNQDEMSPEQAQNLNAIERDFKEDPEYMKTKGIENITRNADTGNMQIEYNQAGANDLGFKSLQTKYNSTGERYMEEIKTAKHGWETNYAPNYHEIRKEPHHVNQTTTQQPRRSNQSTQQTGSTGTPQPTRNNHIPKQPTKPTEPTQPTRSNNIPKQQTQPRQPTQPTRSNHIPKQQTQPTEPTQPTQPTRSNHIPKQPTKPTQPTQSTQNAPNYHQPEKEVPNYHGPKKEDTTVKNFNQNNVPEFED